MTNELALLSLEVERRSRLADLERSLSRDIERDFLARELDLEGDRVLRLDRERERDRETLLLLLRLLVSLRERERLPLPRREERERGRSSYSFTRRPISSLPSSRDSAERMSRAQENSTMPSPIRPL